MGVIGVDLDDGVESLVERHAERVEVGVAEAAFVVTLDDAQPVVVLHRGADERASRIGRRVVDHEDVDVGHVLTELHEQAARCSRPRCGWERRPACASSRMSRDRPEHGVDAGQHRDAGAADDHRHVPSGVAPRQPVAGRPVGSAFASTASSCLDHHAAAAIRSGNAVMRNRGRAVTVSGISMSATTTAL